MHLRHLTVADFRNYRWAEVPLTPGVTTFLGRNGQGKTNLVEAAGYLASLSSHRVSNDAPLVRHGAQRAIVRAAVVRDERESMIELEITPGKANRARLNRAAATRPRDVLGTLRTVLFAPEDLALVKGDPGERRRFLDDLLVARQPRWSGVRSDYDKALRQRNALLKQAVPGDDSFVASLQVWNAHIAEVGAALIYARLRLLRDLAPYLQEAYRTISDSDQVAHAAYQSSLAPEAAEQIAAGQVPDQSQLRDLLLARMSELERNEIERGVTLVGPHRDDVSLTLGDLPAKGYASHGESWSLALGLRLAGFRLLRTDIGTDPVLVLDDVFAELDSGRRERLAELVVDCEQVLVTAAVAGDVPEPLYQRGSVVHIDAGELVTEQP